MTKDKAISFPGDNTDEKELLLTWLDYLREPSRASSKAFPNRTHVGGRRAA